MSQAFSPLIRKIHQQIIPNYNSILKTIKDPSTLTKLHTQITVSGSTTKNVSLSNNLINSYASFGLIKYAQKTFNQIPNKIKNLYSWTILISGFTRNNLFSESLSYFHEMVKLGLLPNEVTISTILPAFSKLGMRKEGKSVHCFWVRRGFRSNVVVETCLVDMYSQFGCMRVARYLFDEMPVRNTVSWNVVISGYGSNEMGWEGIRVFNLMRKEGFFVDFFTFMSLISASSGRVSGSVHGLVIKMGFVDEERIQTSLISMYTSGSLIEEAYGVFSEMRVKDVVAWTLMLEGFSYGQYWSKAMDLFYEMTSVYGVAVDSTVILSILSICSCSGSLQQGCQVHALVEKRGFSNDIFVGSALIDMYASFGDLGNAKKCFDGMVEKDVVCWNSMIRAAGINGRAEDAIGLLSNMEKSGVDPNESTFVSVLSACSHAGLVDEGLRIFNHMIDVWGIIPSLQHYACIIDSLGRSGQLDEANRIISKMTLRPDSGVYGALLSACRVYGNTGVGVEMFQKLLELNLIDPGYFSSISNLHASAGNWEGTQICQEVLRQKGLKKDPGLSLVG